MIREHEIPQGSRLYFGQSAKKKRELEHSISTILLSNNFEEIITPNFSYSQHQSIDDPTRLITFSNENNHQVALRADSTLDVVRIITKRLGRATSHKKWFYMQPVFSYPCNEDYQIGCEWIDHDNMIDIIDLTIQILQTLSINPILQISNINIPRLVCDELMLDITLFKQGELSRLFELDVHWLNQLLYVKTLDDLTTVIPIVPSAIKDELIKLEKTVKNIQYNNMVVSPLYYGTMKYYDDICYRVITSNLTLFRGGSYKSEGMNSLGFALYSDNVLKFL